MIERKEFERVSVRVRSSLRRRIREHPEEFGFPQGTSEASVLSQMLEDAARAHRERQRRKELLLSYEEWADDPERVEANREAFEMAVQDGLL